MVLSPPRFSVRNSRKFSVVGDSVKEKGCLILRKGVRIWVGFGVMCVIWAVLLDILEVIACLKGSSLPL